MEYVKFLSWTSVIMSIVTPAGLAILYLSKDYYGKIINKRFDISAREHQDLLNRTLEDHKNKLQAQLEEQRQEYTKELENHSRNLEKLHTEFQIKISSLHPERLNAIKSMYSSFTKQWEYQVQLVQLVEKAVEDIDTFDIKHISQIIVKQREEKRLTFNDVDYLYLTISLTNQLRRLDADIQKQVAQGLDMINLIQKTKTANLDFSEVHKKQFETWFALMDEFQTEHLLPSLTLMEIEFKDILGVEPRETHLEK